MSPARRSSLVVRAPGVRVTALALAGLLAGGGTMTQAAPAPVDKEAAEAKAAAKEATAKVMAAAKEAAAKEAAAKEAAANDPIPVLEGGRVVGQKTQADARKEGLTVINLSDDWLPTVFSRDARQAAAAAAVSPRPGERTARHGQEVRARRMRTASSRCSGSFRA